MLCQTPLPLLFPVVFSAAATYHAAFPFPRRDFVIPGMSLATFTIVHTAISLIGIVSGLVVLYGMLSGKRLEKWTTLFLLTTVLTSVTGYLFPFEHLLPSHIVGAISLVVLSVALLARHSFHLAGGWRRTYVLTSVTALYLNVFVLVVQSFLKAPALHALAPTGKEPPFAVTQLIVLAVFIWLAIAAVKRFREEPKRAMGQAA
jgi:hypothetical protein